MQVCNKVICMVRYKNSGGGITSEKSVEGIKDVHGKTVMKICHQKLGSQVTVTFTMTFFGFQNHLNLNQH